MIRPIFLNIFYWPFLNAEQVYKMFIDFLKHMGDPGINSRFRTIENSFGKFGENILFVRIVYDAGVCHGPVPVANKKLSLRIDTYLLIVSVLGSPLFLELLHHKIRCYRWRFLSWCYWIFIMTLHLTCRPCGNKSYTGGGTWIQKMCLPIDSHNQLLYCLIHLLGSICIYMISIRSITVT